MKFEPIIGLEVHVELKTKSGLFCGCPADHFGKKPNTATCPVCLGLPGALPVPNKKAIEWCIMMGLALGSEISPESKFDRKNYFYPDLPKGYQISQYDKPLAVGGKLGDVRIRRVHLEEDTAKLIHATVDGARVSLIDFNRSGVPLVEIVTEPDIRSAEEAKGFLQKLQQIIRYLGISDADMEKGSMRLEPNISLKRVRHLKSSRSDLDQLPNYKVEVKNINSFRFVEKAIAYEINRQLAILERGEMPKQETRGYVEAKGSTVSQRSKEEAEDYRYFPEPDIPPMRFAQSQISELESQIPELPDAKKERFMERYELNDYDASLLTETRELADYYEESVKVGKVPAKKLANWIINKRVNIENVLPAELVGSILRAEQVVSVSDEIIRDVLSENAKAVDDYKKGKIAALMFLVGQVMQRAKGKANAQSVKAKITEIING